MSRQRTIAEKISCTGIGLHSGRPVHLTLEPARADTGIVFVRTDLGEPVEIPARPESVVETRMATTLGRGAVRVGTVEHLLAALYGLGIDNVRVGLDGPEVPVMDGSAASFAFLIRSAGSFEQPAERRELVIRDRIEIRESSRRIAVKPAEELRISYRIDFGHPAIGRQAIQNLSVDEAVFEREICSARTFGFLDQVNVLWNAGLARGASLDNAIVLDSKRVLNGEGLRFADEFVRHKVLDLLGDLALLGARLRGHVEVECGGHALHQRLVTEILEHARGASSAVAAVARGWRLPAVVRFLPSLG